MIEHKRDVSLKAYNSFGVDARADEIINFATAGELCEVLSHDVCGKLWTVLSGGNNMLFTRDYRGVLLHPVSRGMSITAECGDKVMVRVEAGVEWDDAVAWCVERGLWGIENLSLIPGYAGAAPVQNIGAYGTEIKDVVESVEVVLTDSLRESALNFCECRFGYRDSIFKGELKGCAVIMAVNMLLSRELSPKLGYGQLEAEVTRLGGPTLENIRKAVIAIRTSKLPDPKITGNAGSFFKNPVVPLDMADRMKKAHPDMPLYPASDKKYSKLAAGWLIDKAGWKGFKRGGVGVHPDQALVLVNLGGATGAQVLELAYDIRDDVKAKFGIVLEMEVNIL